MIQKAIFLDSVGVIALFNQRDQWHDAARRAYESLAGEQPTFVATSHVLLECGNAAARWAYRGDIIEVRSRLEADNSLIHPTEEDWQQGWEAYRKHENANAGIVDQISIIVMRRLGLGRVFGNDQHFRAAGFETLF